MIPISPDKLIPHEDKEEKITYYFKPIIGDSETALYKAIGGIGIDRRPYIDTAKKEVEKKNRGKRWNKGEKEKVIREKALELAKDGLAKSELDISKEIKNIDELIDSTLADWKTERKDIPNFPKDKKPSNYLQLTLKRRLIEVILEINNLTDKESKN